MARLESTVDLAHVPTPPSVIDTIASLIELPDGVVALDPCCGTGAALERLAPKGQRLGVELDKSRAAEAATRLSTVLACPIQDARIQKGCAAVCLLNPPYLDSTDGRLEEVFLDRCTKYIKTGGLLILIIKNDRFDTVIHRLCSDYDVVAHYRFPRPYFDGPELAFGQTVLFAVKRPEPTHTRTPQRYMASDLGFGWENDVKNLPELLPHSGSKIFKCAKGMPPQLFEVGSIDPDEMAGLVRQSPLSRAMRTPAMLGAGSPPLTLKQGHIALTLASGVINGVYGVGELTHLAKGTVVRTETVQEEKDWTSGGKAALNKHTIHSFSIRIRALDPSGAIHDITGGAAGSAPVAKTDEAESDARGTKEAA